MCDAGRQTDRGALGGGGGGRGSLAGQPARGNICPAFFQRAHTHTHTFPPPTHIPTRGAFTVAESHTIPVLTWGMIHQLFRRVYADSPLCDSCVFFPLHGYQLVLVKFSSVLRIRLGFNADPGSSFGQDPFPVRILSPQQTT